MRVDLTTAPRRATTGGADVTRLHDKQWWLHLAERLARTLDAVTADDALARRPAVAVVGESADVWRAWFEHHGAVTDRDDVAMAVCVDGLANLSVPDARERLAALHDRTVQGGRLVLVESVVSRRGRPVRGINDLFVVLSGATGGAVTLVDIAAVTRPDEAHPSTAVLELLRLATPEGR